MRWSASNEVFAIRRIRHRNQQRHGHRFATETESNTIKGGEGRKYEPWFIVMMFVLYTLVFVAHHFNE